MEGSYGDSTVELEIVDDIRAGVGHSAQVLAVKILQAPSSLLKRLGNTTTSTLTAKFYDPLYFDHAEDDGDPFHCVDHHYTHEVATYNRLTELQGTIVPIFYGSYSLEIPIDQSSSVGQSSTITRSVRLILMEYVHGSSMRELEPEDFSQLERKHIMKLLIDGESAIYTHDIRLGDLSPRNVMV